MENLPACGPTRGKGVISFAAWVFDFPITRSPDHARSLDLYQCYLLLISGKVLVFNFGGFGNRDNLFWSAFIRANPQ